MSLYVHMFISIADYRCNVTNNIFTKVKDTTQTHVRLSWHAARAQRRGSIVLTTENFMLTWVITGFAFTASHAFRS